VLQRLEAILGKWPRPTGDDRSASFAVRHIPAQDWNARWARSVQPVRIGRRFVIRPSWERTALDAHESELIIDPKQAFGTGHHATTQLLIEWLEDTIHGGERVLDLGTGSGILAMAAVRLGARSALGLDIDPVAIECAHENAQVNGFGPELQFRIGTLAEPESQRFERWDLIVANLDRRTILAIVPELAPWRTSGSTVLLSGLLREDRDDVATAFGKFGVAIRSSRERDGWLALEIHQA
jgi:ribosomal protein L11 methyltransferase